MATEDVSLHQIIQAIVIIFTIKIRFNRHKLLNLHKNKNKKTIS